LGGSVKFPDLRRRQQPRHTVGTLPFSIVAAGASANLTPVWNTGGTLAGTGYYVLATLYDSSSAFVGTARSNFNIVSDTASLVSPLTSARTSFSYLPSETVLVTSRVSNLTQNQPLDNLTIRYPRSPVRTAACASRARNRSRSSRKRPSRTTATRCRSGLPWRAAMQGL